VPSFQHLSTYIQHVFNSQEHKENTEKSRYFLQFSTTPTNTIYIYKYINYIKHIAIYKQVNCYIIYKYILLCIVNNT